MARFRICPREGQFGIQIPKGAWHSIEVLEPSAIFEAKDGGMGSDSIGTHISCASSYMIITKELLDKLSSEAKSSARHRMNYNFHQSLDDKCHRFLNSLELGTEVPIHRHPIKDERFVA